MNEEISFRPARDDDLDFLFAVYASTRDDLFFLPSDEREKLLRMQFRAQHDAYHATYPAARFDLILVDGQNAGRLYVHHGDHEVRLIDITLLPEFRGREIGKRIMRELLQEAERVDLPLRIHVMHDNPARHLYNRLGFRQIGETGAYHLLEWTRDRSDVR